MFTEGPLMKRRVSVFQFHALYHCDLSIIQQIVTRDEASIHHMSKTMIRESTGWKRWLSNLPLPLSFCKLFSDFFIFLVIYRKMTNFLEGLPSKGHVTELFKDILYIHTIILNTRFGFCNLNLV